MPMKLQIGRQDIASALRTEIVAAETIPPLFDQPAIEAPKYLGKLSRVFNRPRANDFRKGAAAQIDDGNGDPTFAELIVADRLRGSGWDCVWYSAFGNKKIKSWPWDAPEPQTGEIPQYVCKVLTKVSVARQELTGANKATFHGIPDVIAWRQDDLVMIECKHAKHDRLRSDQAEWFQCAKITGLSVTQFGIYEWKFREP